METAAGIPARLGGRAVKGGRRRLVLRLGLVLSLGIVAVLATLVGAWWRDPSLGAQTAPQPSTPAPATEALASPVAPPPELVEDVPFDLLGPEEQTAKVTPGARLEIVFKHYAFGALYRITITHAHGPRSRDLPAPAPIRGFERFSRYCDSLGPDFRALVASADETTAASRLASLQTAFAKKPAEPTCDHPSKNLLKELASAFESHPLREGLKIGPHETLPITVERLSRETRTAVKTWRLLIEPRPYDPPWGRYDEQAWIVHDVSWRMLSFASLAAGAAPPSRADVVVRTLPAKGDRPRWSLGLRGAEYEIVPAPHLWAPATYSPLGASAETRRGSAAHTEGDRALLAELLEPTTERIVRLNQRLSRQLEQTPASPGVHEDAALLLGALALREESGWLYDVRPFLNRMSAHLAMARHLRGGGASGPSGEVAETILLALAGRQQDALGRVYRFGQTEELATWSSSLRLRVTEDWRECVDRAPRALLEQRECFRALVARVSPRHATEYLRRYPTMPLPDWGRLALKRSVDVGTGNLYATGLLDAELREAALVFHASTTGDWPREAEEAMGPMLQAQVIDAAAWNGHVERQVLYAAARKFHHYDYMLGLPEEAEAVRAEIVETFAMLRRYPIVGSSLTRGAATEAYLKRSVGEETGEVEEDKQATRGRELDREACDLALPSLSAAPEVWPLGSWDRIEKTCPRWPDGRPSPPPEVWFSATVPVGTAYDIGRRLATGRTLSSIPDGSWRALHELAPFDRMVLVFLAPRAYGRTPKADEYDSLYGALVDYDIVVMRKSAELRESHVDEYVRRYERLCALDPDSWLQLGFYLADHDREVDAVAAYEKALALGMDRVRLSNGVDWLVDYYLEHGQQERALEVARDAAATGSGAGMTTLARAFERLGRSDEARAYFERTQERYDTNRPLDSFYIRYRARHGGTRYAREAEAAERRLFPSGLNTVTVAELRTSRKDQPDEYPIGQPAGFFVEKAADRLRLGDTIVALDGYRVQNKEQYRTVRGFSDDSVRRVIVWRDRELMELETTLFVEKHGSVE